MNAEVAMLLEKEGLKIPSDPPPHNFVSPVPIEDLEINEKTIDKDELIRISGSDNPLNDTIQKYNMARQYYIYKIKDEKRKKISDSNFHEIKNILMNGSQKDVENLMKERHIWRSEALSNKREICSVETCPSYCINGFKFCINHIVNDPEQKLFEKCSNCGTVKIRTFKCKLCEK